MVWCFGHGLPTQSLPARRCSPHTSQPGLHRVLVPPRLSCIPITSGVGCVQSHHPQLDQHIRPTQFAHMYMLLNSNQHRRRRHGVLSVCAAAGKKQRQTAVSSSLISVLKDELKFERESYRKEELLLEEPPSGYELTDAPGKSVFYLSKQFQNEGILIEVNLDSQPGADGEDSEAGPSEGAGFSNEPDSDDDDEGYSNDPTPVQFTVSIAKVGGKMLVFDCESDGEYLIINHLSLEANSGSMGTVNSGGGGSAGGGVVQGMLRALRGGGLLSGGGASAVGNGSSDDEDEEVPAELEGLSDYTGPMFSDLDETLQQAFLDFLEERGVNAELAEYVRLFAQDKQANEYQRWLGAVKDFVSIKDAM